MQRSAGAATIGGVIDIHTHAYPRPLAEKATVKVREYGVQPVTDGTVEALLASMDGNGIEVAVVCSIATRPGQFPTLLEWCRGINPIGNIRLAPESM